MPVDKESDWYKQHKIDMANRSREKAKSAREIGPLPSCVNAERRESCRLSLKLFLETYQAETFNLPWSDDHLRAIEVMQDVILNGGQYALAMPRRQGKTTMITGATLWAILYGHRKFVVVIAATKADSVKIASNVKVTIESDELIQADFPGACYPIQKLEGVNNRANAQTLNGELTRIRWTREEIVFPNIPSAPSSCARLYCRSITGAIRGLSDKLPDGSTIRPELVLLDDPQTERSAKSAHSTSQREQVISRAVLGLGGAKKRLAGFAAVTVIQEDDLAARLLDRQRMPDWRGDLMKLVYQMPTNMDWWKGYRDKRNELIRFERPLSELNEYYSEHRAIADEGCKVAWEYRHEPDQISAIQYAMDLWAKDEEAFLSEYQNTPRRQELDNVYQIDSHEIAAKLNNLQRGIVPDWADYLTCFIDVQQDALFYLVGAWDRELRGAVVDYGAWPEQGRAYFKKNDIRMSIAEVYKAATVAHGLSLAFDELVPKILHKVFSYQTRGHKQIDCLLIDANWSASTEVIYQLARASESGKVYPHHGRYLSATTTPIEQWKAAPGDKTGPGWRQQIGKRAARHFVTDVNYWKTVVAQRVQSPSDKASIQFFGDRPELHTMLADHLTAEFAQDQSSEAAGRRIMEWRQKPNRDNEWFDCLVGSCVGASFLGGELPGQIVKPERKRVSWREQQLARRGQR